jgi:hypothetical protein
MVDRETDISTWQENEVVTCENCGVELLEGFDIIDPLWSYCDDCYIKDDLFYDKEYLKKNEKS